jgi:hypothetical protein
MTFQDLFVPLRDDQFGQLRRQEPLKPPNAAQLVDLLGNPRLKATVGAVKLNNRSAKSSRIELWRRRQSLPGMQPFLVPKA